MEDYLTPSEKIDPTSSPLTISPSILSQYFYFDCEQQLVFSATDIDKVKWFYKVCHLFYRNHIIYSLHSTLIMTGSRSKEIRTTNLKIETDFFDKFGHQFFF